MPIEIIIITDVFGNIKPLRFRMQIQQKPYLVVNIDKIKTKNTLKICGIINQVCTCTSIINNIEKIYELRFNTKSCIWVLYKI